MELIIAGDFYPNNRVARLIELKRFDIVFSKIKEIISNSDYSIVNLEAPIITKKINPIKKTGPNLYTSLNSFEALKYCGFKAVSLANNHFYDFGNEGVLNTISILNDFSLDYVGAGTNIEEAEETLYIEIKGVKIGFINFCENEWSIATTKTGGSAPLNPIKNFYQIREAKDKADYIIVIVHGGKEHYQLPLPRMQETYRFFIEIGADIVINHHQHCFSGYEIFKNKPIFYGLGNFCFDSFNNKRNKLWEEGYLLKIIINDKLAFEIIPYNQCSTLPSIEPLDDSSEFWIKMNYLNEIIRSPSKLEECFSELISHESREYLTELQPLNNKYLKALQRRKLFPLLRTKNYNTLILNLIRCETHRDIIIECIKKSM